MDYKIGVLKPDASLTYLDFSVDSLLSFYKQNEININSYFFFLTNTIDPLQEEREDNIRIIDPGLEGHVLTIEDLFTPEEDHSEMREEEFLDFEELQDFENYQYDDISYNIAEGIYHNSIINYALLAANIDRDWL